MSAVQQTQILAGSARRRLTQPLSAVAETLAAAKITKERESAKGRRQPGD
jgi:hypothetical protein